MLNRERMVGNYLCLGEIVGKGSFATVFKGYHQRTKEVVAIKEIDIDRLPQNNKKLLSHLDQEIAIMKTVRHKNLVQLLDVINSDRIIYLVLEYCSEGDFGKYLAKQPNKRLPEKKAQYFMRHLAQGLQSLRTMKIIHRDLKPQNLLLGVDPKTKKKVLKIADFGFARIIETHDLVETLCGSPLYMAPEVLESQQPYDHRADLWSVGAIMFQTLVGRPPFMGQTCVDLMNNLRTKEVEVPTGLGLSPECVSLLLMLLQKDPAKRATWETFFMHPWLNPKKQAAPPPPAAAAAALPTLLSPFTQVPAAHHALQGQGGGTAAHLLANYPLAVQPPPPSLAGAPHSLTQPIAQSQPVALRMQTALHPTHQLSAPAVADGVGVLRPEAPPQTREHALTFDHAPRKPKTNPFRDDTDPSPSSSFSAYSSKASRSALEEDFMPLTHSLMLEEKHKPHVRFTLNEIIMAARSLVRAGEEKALTKPSEAFGFLHVALSLIKECILRSKTTVFPLSSGTISSLQTQQMQWIARARALVPTASRDAVCPAELAFHHALWLGREGAVNEELLKNFGKAREMYRMGVVLLVHLLGGAADSGDRHILTDYIAMFCERLESLRCS